MHSSLLRRSRATFAVGLAAMALLATGCGEDTTEPASDASGGDTPTETITIGHQAFGESEILAHIYGDVLEAEGFSVEYQSFKDRAAIYAAIDTGDVNLVPEYAASALEFLNENAGEASGDIDATMEKLRPRLADVDLAAAEASDAVDTNSLVVTKDTAEAKSLSAISDLTADLRLGGPQDCPTNASCLPALQNSYGLDLSANFVPLDLGGPLTKEALKQGDIDVAVIFSTDASIADNDWLVLEDDQGIFNADNIVPVGSVEFVEANAEILDRVSATLTTSGLTNLNKRFDIDKDDADVIAKDFIAENDL